MKVQSESNLLIFQVVLKYLLTLKKISIRVFHCFLSGYQMRVPFIHIAETSH